MTAAASSQSPADDNFIVVDGLRRYFRPRGTLLRSQGRRTVKAVDGVSFELKRRRTLSLVGESGCGKSTTARLVLGLDQPSDGRILFQGTDLTALSRRQYREYRLAVQAVFQDPADALNPRRTVGSIIAEPLVVNPDRSRVNSRDARAAKVEELIAAVGLPASTFSSFPGELSGGMRQRVAIAQALALTPAAIVLDEPVSALDVSIRAQILNLLRKLQREYGVAYLLIAHDLATVAFLSDDIAAMYLGKFVEKGPAASVLERPLHPYTIALASAADLRERERIVLSSDDPSPTGRPSGCAFHPRCWLRDELGRPDACVREVPALRPFGVDRLVACHFAEELSSQQRRSELVRAAATGGSATLKITTTSGPMGDPDDDGSFRGGP